MKFSISVNILGLIYAIACFLTSLIGYTIHRSVIWSIIDFIFMPLTWCKWFIYHEASLSIIKQTFEWFFK